ncbi:MAG: rod shape-determining protein MreC [Campylobacterales bacterium]|nr:rod shape-determining protein MreC [Campylobacterales bacterium]
MSKHWLVAGSFVAALFAVYYYFGDFLQRQIEPLSGSVRYVYQSASKTLSDSIDMHFMQAGSIAKLKKENEELQKEALTYKNSLRDIGYRLNLLNGMEINQSISMKPTKALSYSNLPNLYRVWTDFKPSVPEEKGAVPKVYGLVYPTQNKIDSVACGILLKNENGSHEAFLNGDPKCSYGVYVGKNRAPGVMYGKNQDKMVIKYIPTWMEVKVGDEVITSGLDNIFFEGVKVGIVKSVSSDNAYKEVQVAGYYNPLSPNYFYVIEKAK